MSQIIRGLFLLTLFNSRNKEVTYNNEVFDSDIQRFYSYVIYIIGWKESGITLPSYYF